MPRKNIRPFGPFKQGLVEIKLGQLLNCIAIDKVVLSTNDEEIIEFAHRLRDSRLEIHRRDEDLSSSRTSTDALVSHACELIRSGHILWTHVTSPFVGASVYADVINVYRLAIADESYDSIMTTTLNHGFLWNEVGPLNYDRSLEKWPRTQTLAPVHEINSAAFLAPAEVYVRHQDRIGVRPRLYPIDRLTGLDIDWEQDFVIAEQLLNAGLVST